MSGAERHRDPVAIVGMDCIFPGARDLRAFWENNVRGVDAIREIDPDRWDPTEFEVRARRGGFVDGLTEFDPIDLKVMPASVREGGAEQFLVASIVHRALRDASRGREVSEADLAWVPGERTDVVVGRGGYLGDAAEHVHLRVEAVEHVVDLLRRLGSPASADSIDEIRKALIASLAPVTPETVASAVPNLCAGRVSNRLDLMGQGYNVDAACASALVAVDTLVRSLQEGRCDLGIAAGVHLIQKPGFWFVFQTLGALSPTQTIRPFSADADGLVIGEGLGAVVLKRLSDAERDGDRIYAVIRGVGVASDGRGAGIMTPRLDGEALAIRRGWSDAGLDPADVTLIEGHGTAMTVGDETEIAALRATFPDAARRRIALGSVKSMIGHAMPAAGMAGLIRAALSLYHRVRPATLNVTKPNDGLRGSSFFLNTESSPWIGRGDGERLAGVNAFGFGGINAHVVLSEAREDASPRFGPRDSELFLFSSGSRVDLARTVERWRRIVAGRNDLRLEDLACASVSRWVPRDRVRVAIVASDHADFAAKAERTATILEEGRPLEEPDVSFGEGDYDGRFAVLFPGIGFPGLSTSYTRRLGVLCRQFPDVRKVIDEADALVRAIDPDGPALADQFFPPPMLDEDERLAIDKDLAWSERTAIGILMSHLATWRLLQLLGIAPDALVGFSLGEVAALMAAEAIDLDPEHARPEVVRAWRAMKVMSESVGSSGDGLWAMVAAPSDRVEAAMRGVPGTVSIAMDATPGQVIVAGDAAAVRGTLAKLRDEGIWSQELPQLPFLMPFLQIHTDLARSMNAQYGGILGGLLERLLVRGPRIPVWSGTSGERFAEDPRRIREAVSDNILRPVRIRPVIESLWGEGFRLFVSLGAGRGLLHNVRTTLGLRDHVAIAMDRDDRDPVREVQALVGRLATLGAAVDPGALFRGRLVRQLDPDRLPEPRRPNILPLSPPRFEFDEAAISTIRRFVGGGRDRDSRAAPSVMPPGTSGDSAGLDRVFEEFLAMEEEIERRETQFVERYLAERSKVDARSVAIASWPLAGRVVRSDGRSLESELVLDLGLHPFLLDHVLLSVPVELKPPEQLLPTLPLTFGVEIMSEAAATLAGRRNVVAVEDVSASRWIPLEDARSLALRIRVDAVGDGRFDVGIAPAGDSRDAMRGTVVFGDLPTAAVAPIEPPIDGPSLHSAAEYYEDGPLFHGSRFHVLASLDGIGAGGAIATVDVPEFDSLFTHPVDVEPLAAPMVVDGLGQILGYRAWLDGRLVLPVGFRRLRVFGRRPKPGSRLRGAMVVTNRDGRFLEADLEACDETGRPWLRVEGWKVWRVIPPKGVMGERRGSRELSIARETGDGRFAVSRRDLGNIEPAWIARVYLRDEEWSAWRKNPVVERLLVTVAAKDAARGRLRAARAVVLHPLEVAVADDGEGRVMVTGVGIDAIRVRVELVGDEAIAFVE